MLKALSTCILTAVMPGMAAWAETALPAETPLARVDKKMPMLEFFRAGSVIPKSSIVEYDGPRITALLTAAAITVSGPQSITGTLLNIYLYGKGGETTHFYSGEAAYFLDKNLVISLRETTLEEKSFSARGTGLYLNTETRQGILLGPVHTAIHMDQLKLNK